MKLQIDGLYMELFIKEKRESKKMSQSKLGKLSGVNRGYISQIESGQYVPSLITIAKIAEALKCSIDELVTIYSGKGEIPMSKDKIYIDKKEVSLKTDIPEKKKICSDYTVLDFLKIVVKVAKDINITKSELFKLKNNIEIQLELLGLRYSSSGN